MTWKRIIIDGAETDYDVSDDAQVRRHSDGKISKQYLAHSKYKGKIRYHYTVLIKDASGAAHQLCVKRLVATAHVPNPHNYNTVIRLRDETNYADNLQWASRSEVIKSAMANVAKGEKHGRFGMKASKETKNKMKLAHTGKSKYKGRLICEGRKFNSLADAAKHFKVTSKTVLDRIKSDKQEWKGWAIRETKPTT